MTNIQIKLLDGRVMNAALDETNAPITVANFLKLIRSEERRVGKECRL